jgi:hypothetical protein
MEPDYSKCITLPNTTKINTLIFAVDQVMQDDAKVDLQRAVFTLQNTGRNFEM